MSGLHAKHRLTRCRHFTIVRSVLGVFFTFALLFIPTVSWASWISSGTGSGGHVTAGSVTTPGVPTPTQIVGGKTVSVTWSAVSGATSYEVLHQTAATGGTTTSACTSAGTSCVDSTARISNAWYSVRAFIGTNWLADSARVAYVPDVATSVAITSLASDSGASASDFITNVASNTLTGTSEANASIVVKRSGSQIATATANGSGNWTSSSFTLSEGLQNLDVTATDAYANTATATQSNVRLDTVLPLLTVSARTSCAGTVCGTATDPGSGFTGISSVKWKLQRTLLSLLTQDCYQSSSSSWISCTGYGFQDSTGTPANWASPTITFNTLLYSYKVAAQSTDIAGNVTSIAFSAY